MSKKPWFILELETGYIDGWYSGDFFNPDVMAKHWDDRRPEYTHIVASLESKDRVYIPDKMFLANALLYEDYK